LISGMRLSITKMTREYGLMNRKIKQLTLLPAKWGVANRGDSNQQQLQASLLVGDSPRNAGDGDDEHNTAVMNSISARESLCPLQRNIFGLWQDYIEGIGWRDLARNFSFSERGCVSCLIKVVLVFCANCEPIN
jgi:hypothetical protein